jgi:hypothetical protein
MDCNTCIATYADLVFKILAGTGAVIAFVVGFRQYRWGQKLQKTRILGDLIDSFENDKLIEAACSMLDWDEREVVMEGGAIPFKNEMLVSALKVVLMDQGFSKEESYIRDSFDAFFDFFEKLYSFQKRELLAFEDFDYFYYWLELVRDIEKYKGSPEIQKAIDQYIDSYYFIGVRKLLTQYSKNPQPLALENKS